MIEIWATWAFLVLAWLLLAGVGLSLWLRGATWSEPERHGDEGGHPVVLWDETHGPRPHPRRRAL